MSVEVGQVVSGKVTGITHFGAFIELPDNQSGLVHISEVSESFVKNINDLLNVGDEIDVKVIKITPDGKINLSIRQAKPSSQEEKPARREFKPKRSFEEKVSRETVVQDTYAGNSRNQRAEEGSGFDQLMNQFLKDSEDRLTSLRRNTEGKRGGRGGRRG